MRKEQTFKALTLAMLSTAMVWWLSVSLVSCTSDDSGVPPSLSQTEKAAPLRFTLNMEGYEDTRGVVSNDMDESVGLFAYIYEDSWTDASPTPNFMYNEEMQFNGTQWQTVNTFEQPDKDLVMRFYAYYPFGLDEEVLDLSSESQIGAPDLTYTVPQDMTEQVDLMAGKSVSDIASENLRAEGSVTIKVSHLLTAVKFQLGKCSEAGRITKIVLKRVLGKNTYQLSETLEYIEDPSNPGEYLTDPLTGQFLTTPVTDGWLPKPYSANKPDFTDFTAELSQKVTLTKTQVVDGQTVVVPQPLLTDDNAFLMLPQTLPAGSTLEVTINCGGGDHVLTANMEGMKWLQGKVVTYTLDITSLTKLTVRSQITPWNEHETIDGVASDGVTILMGTGIDDWNGSETNIGSDDPRTTP